jgi:Transposase zinc-binding domain
MDRPLRTVADVFRRYGDSYRDEAGASLSTAQRRVIHAIERCRTAALGGHVEQCDDCGHTRVWYNSCLMESASFWGARVSSRLHTLDLRPIRRAMHSP